MKKYTFILLTILLMGFFFISASNSKNYTQMWKEVKEKESNSLPKSSLDIVDKILRLAIAEKNTEQAIKATIYKIKFESDLNTDNQIDIFSALESLIPLTDNEVDKALLHSLLAELYANYYALNSWTINQRTNIEADLPADIKLWTKNIFQNQVLSHLKQSVTSQKALLNTSIGDYRDIFIIEQDTEQVYPTMYDFLMKRAITISTTILDSQSILYLSKELANHNITIAQLASPTDDFVRLRFSDNNSLTTLFYYSKFLESLLSRNLIDAIVFTELDRNNYLSSKFHKYQKDYAGSFLEALKKRYADYDVSVEIIYNQIIANNNDYIYRNGETVQDTSILAQKYNLLVSGIQKYPNYYRLGVLKDALQNLTRSYAYISGRAVFYPTSSKSFDIKYQNISEIDINIVDDKGKEVFSKNLKVQPNEPYLYQHLAFSFDLDKIGSYLAKVKCTNIDGKTEIDSISFRLSKIASFTRTNPDDSQQFYIVDRKSGTPISGAEISLYTRSYNNDVHSYVKQATIITDWQGLASYNKSHKDSNLYYRVKKDRDESDYQYCREGFFYYSNDADMVLEDKVNIFTDRGLYRPGQVIYYKAIKNSYNNQRQPIPSVNKRLQVKLYDVNNQLVSQKELITNEFGSIAGEFIIPKEGLNGSYRLNIDGYDAYVRVEEYKRPTFEIVFNKIDKAYTFGDLATISGYVQNFSGIKLQNTIVEYSITKKPLYRWWNNNSSENIDYGIVKTDAQGRFEIEFKIPIIESGSVQNSLFNRDIFNFEITTTVTDLNGETQSNSTNVVVANISMILKTNIPDKIERNSNPTINITAANLNGEKIQTSGTYTISSVLANDSIEHIIANGQFNTTNNTKLSKEIEALQSGKYLIVFQANDDKGRSVKTQNYFIIYSTDDKRPPITTNEWLIDKNAIFKDGKPAEIIIGVSSKDVTILYELMKDGNLQYQEQFVLSDENKKISIPYKNIYDDNVTALFTYIIDEKLYQNQIDIKKQSTVNDLTLKWNVFRDKVRPDQKEEWSIEVKDSKGNPVSAELLASMYDASLDKLLKVPQWDLVTRINNYTSTYAWQSPNFQVKNSKSISFYRKDNYYPPLQWTSFNWFDFAFGYAQRSMLRSYAFAAEAPLQKNESVKTMSKTLSMNEDMSEQKEFFKESEYKPQIRNNFDETAFFYPQLKTNSKGETTFSFTVPGSNTTWNFRALAYDKSFDSGTLTSEVISRKELMVTPNIPRFIRQGDKTTIATKISNLSDAHISGKVYLEFFDPLTDKTISNITIQEQAQDFTLISNASTEASWLFDVPEDIDILGCRIIAQSKTFSDGEQHTIAVLPNKMLITESMPIDMYKNGVKDFTFESMIKNKSQSLTNYRLTLQYANNPAWYAIQALPTIDSPINGNTISWFASYYANTLGEFIMKQYPKISNAINNWISNRGSTDSFVSQLQKNEELKIILLEETPWVLEAKNETEQMQQLALLLNLNNTSIKSQAAINKLVNLQNEDGGWSWFNGMRSNKSVTQYILFGLSELTNLQAVEYSSEVKEMQIKALKYLDNQVENDYKTTDWTKVKSIPTSLIEFMYVRSEYRDIPIKPKTREIERIATNIVEKNWQILNYYEQSLLVVLAKRNGNKELMNKLIDSLREHATISSEMGMYWANNTSTAFMSQSAVSTHTFIMEAFKQAGADDTEMNEMKQWLLKQKQTQQWESTLATLDAVYALLSNGTNWFTHTNDNARIFVGGKLVQNKEQDNIVGYIQQSWYNNEISSDMATVRVEKTNTNPSWGAMYWQYFDNINKIDSDNSKALSINKQYFILKNGSLYPITANNNLKIGDQVTVHLIVKTDRDLDFVQIKDMRPSCFEPISQLSEYKYMNNVGYYQSQEDASTNLFFDVLPKGTYVFEYSVYANRAGLYSSGITTIQCMYAPQYISHTSGRQIEVQPPMK